jgi:hypothetical protein
VNATERLRKSIIAIEPAASHRADQPPRADEIYAPSHHVAALDPDNALVVGIRGVGKSFWAGALGDRATREVTAEAFPKLGLDKYTVGFGFTGFEGSAAPSPEIVDNYANEIESAKLFWRIIVLRSFAKAASIRMPNRIDETMKEFRDPETREEKMREIDAAFSEERRRFLLVFDALDTLSNEWPKLRILTRALLEVTYAMRSYRSLRLKLFLRPEQLDDPGVGFTDLSKLKAAKIDLSWDGVDLYGLFFSHLANDDTSRRAFERIVTEHRLTLRPLGTRIALPASLARNTDVQANVFAEIAGRYMGSDHRKGKTYTWLPKHLADGFRQVTPRSFLVALRQAAITSEGRARALSIEGIKDGLRAASELRVDQLKEEYKWIELALAPLAGLRVPCSDKDVIDRWIADDTVDTIAASAKKDKYLAPSEMILGDRQSGASMRLPRETGLLETLLNMGVLEQRVDGRINMPDIYRIGAEIVGRGRVAPRP